MEINLNNFVYSRFNNEKKIHSEKDKIKNEYFSKLNDNMVKKSLECIENVKKRIINDINKKTFDRKYQITSFIEYKMIVKWYNTLNINNYKLTWCHDQNGLTK